ncbi:MAG: GAF domain-containing protein [Leptolyngbyaceae cyanobacterium SL_7_1]|nr:GAF domain-containing protein [Leptolyngbyaceae cyanobacterium SL_7_1]
MKILCFTQTPFPRDRFQPGAVTAVQNVAQTYAKSPCLLKFLKTVQVRAKLLVPIAVQDELWGFLIAHDCHHHRQWRQEEQQFLQHIGEHLSIAISQAQLYSELHQQKDTLEERVIDRTQALYDAMTAAQVANQLKGDFLAAVSHELRTPLTCIIGMSATLMRWSAEQSDRQQTFLQAIHNSGETLLDLINNILELSQLQTGNALLDLSEFSISLLVQQVLKDFQRKASTTKVELKLDLQISSSHDRVIADPRRVRQILANLLSNAIKFTPAGTVTLRAVTDDSSLLFQVKDTGIGIAEQQRSLLFQQFQQLDGSRQREYGGTGLGLALTKQLVEMQGGTIEVRSTVGVGSVFTVRLPRLRALDPALSSKPVLSTDPALGRIVLLANQDETAEVICDILTAAGYQLVWMMEGSNAVTQIELLQPLLVIVDTQLSNGDCYEVLRSLKQNPITNCLKVLALVTETNATPSPSLQPVNADHFLTKPIHPETILLTVDALRIVD